MASITMADAPSISFYKACKTGKIEALHYYLDHAGVDANICTDSHETNHIPLHVAVKFQRLEAVRLLLQYGAEPTHVGTALGASALHLACREDAKKISLILNEYIETDIQNSLDLEMMKVLVDFGASVNVKTHSGDTPMSYVFGIDHLRKIDEYFRDFDDVELVINESNQEYRKRQKDKIVFLLSHGADVRRTYKNGDTILHLAIRDTKASRQWQNLDKAMHYDDCYVAEIVEVCLMYGAAVNAKNNAGESPLQLAVALLSYATVKVLLEYNANVTDIRLDCFQYEKSTTPCLRATDNSLSIIEALKCKGFDLHRRHNLNFMDFFISNNSKASYNNLNYLETRRIVKNLLRYGTDDNIQTSVNKLYNNTVFNMNDARAHRVIRGELLFQIYRYLSILETDNLYASDVIKDYLWLKIHNLDPNNSKFRNEFLAEIVMEELECLKKVELRRGLSLYEVLCTNPQDCYWRIQRYDHQLILGSERVIYRISECMDIIEGHFAKCLVRRYIVESTKEYLPSVIAFHLPDACWDHIFSYLSNESLWFLCAAAVD